MVVTGLQQTKQERKSLATRERLMKATLAVIKEDGWSGTTTQKICEKCGVSRGAQTHHFKSKNELISAAIEMIALEYQKRILGELAELPESEKTFDALLQMIWRATLDDEFMIPSMDALAAARTDLELRELCQELDNRAVNTMRGFCADLKIGSASRADMEDAIELSIYLFRSLVIERGLHGDDKYHQAAFEKWSRLLHKALNISS